jgi:hypothetical protein
MDSKFYIEFNKKLDKWIVRYRGEVQAHFSTQNEALEWGLAVYPGHGYEIERVHIRSNSPRGVKRGEWR